MGETINDQPTDEPIEAGAAGAPEGAVHEPTTNDVDAMYKELGIKRAAPTGAAKGRPKATNVRAKDSDKNGTGSADSGSADDSNDEDKSKNAPASNEDGSAGRKGNSDGKKTDEDSGKLLDESEEADAGVRDAKSKSDGDSEQGREKDSELGNDGAGQKGDESDDEAEEGEDADDEGKRPGKSNPKIEQRIQRLTEERRAAEERAEALEQQLREREQAVQQAKISQEDPEYKVEDFSKVRDEDGNILDLDPDEAELAWRRWKDGYDQRAEQRNAEANRQQQEAQQQEARAEQIMRSSVAAYDHLASMMDDFPELVSDSGQFDAEFAARAMPIVQKAIVYEPGTEPGNPEGNAAVIMGLRVDPKDILEAMRDIRNEKRTLPLNGLNDNIESRSNVNVPHRRSSDPTINAANELYQGLGIDKRL